MVLRVLSTLVPLMLSYLRYWRNDSYLLSTRVMFDKPNRTCSATTYRAPVKVNWFRCLCPIPLSPHFTSIILQNVTEPITSQTSRVFFTLKLLASCFLFHPHTSLPAVVRTWLVSYKLLVSVAGHAQPPKCLLKMWTLMRSSRKHVISSRKCYFSSIILDQVITFSLVFSIAPVLNISLNENGY